MAEIRRGPRELHNPKYIRWGHGIADLCYRRARGIVAVTEGIRDRLRAKGLSGGKVFLIKNGTNPERFRPVCDPDLRDRLGWKGQFIVLYAGVHGIAQGLETLLQAALRLKSRQNMRFVLIGEGPVKDDLRRFARRNDLANVQFLPEVPSRDIARYISLADICLVPLKKLKLFEGALPSKIFDYWACGKPLLLTVDGEARRELERAGGGVYVAPENPQALASALIELQRHPSDCRQMGQNGRRYVRHHGYLRSHQARRLAEVLAGLVSPGVNRAGSTVPDRKEHSV